MDYKCGQCIKCITCGAKEAGKTRNNKWSKDFNFCSSCNRKRKSKSYCQVCQEMWHSENVDDLVKEGPNQMICCYSCQTWSHIRCDLLLQDPQIQNQLVQGGSDLRYSCQKCRREARVKFAKKVVEDLEADDKNGIYADAFWIESE